MDDTPSFTKPIERGRSRITLRLLLCAFTISTILLGLWIASAFKQKVAADNVKAIGGNVDFDTPSREMGARRPQTMPDWLRTAIGENRRTVILSGQDLSDADAFRKISQLEGLESLSLTRSKFDSSEIEHLADCSSLRMLFVGNTAVNDDSISSICKLRNLEKLNIGRTNVTDASMKRISSLSKLKYLCLMDTAVTDASVPHIAKLKNLEVLELYGSAISDAGVDQLRAALPSCDIKK